MSTYMQLIVEVTTGDDLALDHLKKGDKMKIILPPLPKDLGLSAVIATLHSVAYIPEEAIE